MSIDFFYSEASRNAFKYALIRRNTTATWRIQNYYILLNVQRFWVRNSNWFFFFPFLFFFFCKMINVIQMRFNIAGLVQESTSKVEETRTSSGTFQSWIRTSVQRFNATLRRRTICWLFLQRLDDQSAQSPRIKDQLSLGSQLTPPTWSGEHSVPRFPISQ